MSQPIQANRDLSSALIPRTSHLLKDLEKIMIETTLDPISLHEPKDGEGIWNDKLEPRDAKVFGVPNERTVHYVNRRSLCE